MITKLVWDKVSEDEWQAGGLARHYSIVKCDNGRFSVRHRKGDEPSTRLFSSGSLEDAQRRCQGHLDNRTEHARREAKINHPTAVVDHDLPGFKQ